MRTKYRIDSYQQTYFVIDSFAHLFDATAPDFTPLYQQLASMDTLAADQSIASDSRITVG